MVTFTKRELTDIKYVTVTMVLKTDKLNKAKGLFIGCKPLVETHTQLVANDEEFVWIQRGENVYILNADHYDVDAISIKASEVTTQYGARVKADAIMQLKEVQKTLTAEKRILATGLIDITAYDVPKDIQTKLGTESEKKTVSKPLYGTDDYYNSRKSTANYKAPASTWKRKVVSTLILKRTTKYTITGAITKMKAKIEEIRNGTYKAPELSKIPADNEKQEKGTSADGDDDYCSMYGQGMMG